MNHSPAELIRAVLVDADVAVDPPATPWPVYVGHLPDAPDNAVCVYDTAGFRDGRIQATGESIVHPGWNIRVRGTTHSVAWVKMSAIQAALDAVRNLTVAIGADSYIVASISQNAVLALGQEPGAGNRRNGFTLNGTVTFRED